MSERTPMETLREIEDALKMADSYFAISDDSGAEWEVDRALRLLRELREGAVEGWVAAEDVEHHLWPFFYIRCHGPKDRPALLLTTKPREEG